MPGEPRTGITCQRCWLTSWHPKDVEEGYCGHCHDWTHGLVVTTDLPVEMFRTESVAPRATGYEGRCDYCKRDIGAGHEQWCPYWHPKPSALWNGECPNVLPHGPHEWFDDPPALRHECSGTADVSRDSAPF